jgi:lipopolysaccharide biosynthesis glycosyltransferase
MNPGTISYESIIKLKNMIFNINNSSEIIVYNASNVLNDFLIRSDNYSKFLQEYAKLYAFKIIKDVKVIIFLDGDDCIVQKDLNYLYELNMEDIYARGITEDPSVFRSMSWMDKYLYDRSHYINTGVMLVNLELCRQFNIYEQARRLNNDNFYLETEEPFQDIINILMRKKIEFLAVRYNKINFYESSMDRKDESKWYSWMVEMLKNGFKNNHFYTKEELIDADENPVIIHYAWDRHLNKTISKYEEAKNFYAKLSGLIN